jgi:flagellar motility protein MotE (MotC chaperone)
MNKQSNQNGYDQFFKAAAQKNQAKTTVKVSVKGSPASDKVVEERLRKALGPVTAKKKKPFPRVTVFGSVVLIAMGVTYLAKPDLIDQVSKKVEIKFMGQANAEEKPAETKAKDAAAKPEAAKDEASPKAKAVQEDLSYIDKLRTRKEELDLREKELNQLEEELQRQKVEVDGRIRKLENMRRDIASVLKERVESDDTQINKLVDLYSNMKPKQAADVIGSLQEDLAVTVLGKMKKKNAAEVMNLLPADKARGLSEKLTGYKR